jgi:hypothetical protein
MDTHRTAEGSKEHALLDRAVLEQMLEPDRQRPRSDDELDRAFGPSGDVRESLHRLRARELIHRWHDMSTAAHAAVRFNELTHADADENLAEGDRKERAADRTVLEILLARSADGKGPATAIELYEAFGAKKEEKRLEVDDALDRLRGDGLIECRGGRAIASDVARRLDELLTI